MKPIQKFLLDYITFLLIGNFRITLNANIVTIATFYSYAIQMIAGAAAIFATLHNVKLLKFYIGPLNIVTIFYQ